MFEFQDVRTVKEIEFEECKSYELEFHERQSLAEIERMLSANAYKDVDMIREHMALLEHLQFKFHSIQIEELKEGYPTVEVDWAIAKISALLKKLTTTLYALDLDLRFSLSLPTHKFKY